MTPISRPLRAWRARFRSMLEPCLIIGEDVRDWWRTGRAASFFPYDAQTSRTSIEPFSSMDVALAHPTGNRRHFSRSNADARLHGINAQFTERSCASSLRSITFAFVATHNHFMLDRGGKVFNRSAPVIKLPEGATEDDHLALLGVLNSSTACFWLKQVSHRQRRAVAIERGLCKAEDMGGFYEFTGTQAGAVPASRRLCRWSSGGNSTRLRSNLQPLSHRPSALRRSHARRARCCTGRA